MNSQNSDSEDDFQIDINDCNEMIELNDKDMDDVDIQNLQDKVEDVDITEDFDDITVGNNIQGAILKRHTKPIFNIDISLKHNLLITGGEDDIAYIWPIFVSSDINNVTSTILALIPGHKDSIIFAKFNFEESFFATGDMSGKIQIFELKDILNQIDNTKNKSNNSNETILKDPYSSQETSDLSWVDWHPNFNKVVIAGTEEGDVYIVKFDKSKNNQCKILSHGQNQKASIGKVLDINLLAVGYGNGDIKIWDMKAEMCIVSISNLLFAKGVNDVPSSKPFHQTEITCLDVYQNVKANDLGKKHLLISSSVDGEIKLFDIKDGKYLADFNFAENIFQNYLDKHTNENLDTSIESLSFNPFHADIFFAASLNGNIYIWDFVKRKIRHTCSSHCGIVKAIWSMKDPNLLISAHLDGSLKIWNTAEGSLIKSCQIHTDAILDFVLSKDESYLATASEDTTAKLICTKDII